MNVTSIQTVIRCFVAKSRNSSALILTPPELRMLLGCMLSQTPLTTSQPFISEQQKTKQRRN